MDTLVLFETQAGYKYYFDYNLQRFNLCHPILFYLLTIFKKGIDPKDWIELQKSKKIEIPKLGKVEKNRILYYLEKFYFLKNSGYFLPNKLKERYDGMLTTKDIEYTLANLRQITFEVTDNCNLNCEYCTYGKFYNDFDKRRKKNLNIKSAVSLIKYLLKYWNSSLNISHSRVLFISFYGGEPLLNFSFIKKMVHFINELKTENKSFVFSITTNGLLLEKYMDFLVKENFNILLSLDGNFYNNGFRVYANGKPSFSRIVRNIEILRDNYPGYFQEKVAFNSVLHRKNSVEEIFNFFQEKFLKIPNIAELSTSGIAENYKEKFREIYKNINSSLQKSNNCSNIEKEIFIGLPSIKDLSNFIHLNTDFCFRDYNDLIYKYRNRKRTPAGTCLPFSKKIFVTVNGKLFPCERVSHKHCLGFINGEKVFINYNEIAKKYNNYYQLIKNKCSECYFAETCEICFLQEDEGSFFECRYFGDEKIYSDYLSKTFDILEKEPFLFHKIQNNVNRTF